MFWRNKKKKKITDDPDIKYKIEKHEVVRGKNIQYDRNGNLIGSNKEKKILDNLFEMRNSVLGICDKVRMLLESPNSNNYELQIIEEKAMIEEELRWLEREKIKCEEIDEIVIARFISETIELVKKEKEKWNNLEKNDTN